MNNVTYTEMLSYISEADQYTQLAIYGSWMFSLTSRCIDNAMTHMPRLPDVGSGVDAAAAYEHAERSLLEDMQRTEGDYQRTLPGMIALRAEIGGLLEEQGGEVRSWENTATFKASLNSQSKPPSEEFLGTVYDELCASPDELDHPMVDKETYVAMQLQQLAQQRDYEKTYMDYAAAFCQKLEGMTQDPSAPEEFKRGYGDVDDSMFDILQDRALAKIDQRFAKMDQLRTNISNSEEFRRTIHGDQLILRDIRDKVANLAA